MGGKQSKLKKELEALKADAVATKTKHDGELESIRSEKRMLEFKLHALQEMTAKAQVEAEKATQLALESEEKMKALKWELVRRLSVPANTTPVSPSGSVLTASTSSSSSVSSRSSSITSTTSSTVDPATSAIPRVPVNWKLKDGVVLRRSNTSYLSKPRSKTVSELSDLKIQVIATSTVVNTTPSTVSKRMDLVMAPVSKSRISESSSNQDDATESKPPTLTSAPSVAPPVVSPATTPAVVASAAAAAVSDFDKFAPVKRRSLNRDVVAVPAKTPIPVSDPAAPAIVEAQAKHIERIESFTKGKRTKDDDASAKSDSESDRAQSFKSDSSSSKSDDGDAMAASKSRGVRAATKGMGPQPSKATVDDVLALSDDEED